MRKLKLLVFYSISFFFIGLVNLILGLVRIICKLTGLIVLLVLTPFIYLFSALFLFLDILIRITTKREKIKKNFDLSSRLASIIILNWNGEKMIKKCLDSVVQAVKYSGKPHEIIVVDNGSTDKSPKIVEKEYPKIKLIKLKSNIYFSGGNNIGIKAAKNDVIILLNNDMIIEKDSLGSLLKHFNKKGLFSVSFQVFFQDLKKRREETGRTKGIFSRGNMNVWHANITKKDKNFDTVLYGGGGAAAFNKKMVIYLGGLDTLYEPFYWEDTDLSFRAWRRGWFSIVEPQSIAYHKHQATSSLFFKREFINQIKERNKFLFIWKNILSFPDFTFHFLLLPYRLIKNLLFYGLKAIKPFFLALGKYGLILNRRRREFNELVYQDKEIFRYSNNLFCFREHRPDLFPKKSKKLNILYICPYLPSIKSHAGANRMYQVVKRIHDIGHRVSVICFASTKKEFKQQHEIKPFCENLKVILRRPVFSAQNFIQRDFLNNDFYSPEFEKKLLDLLNKNDFDIVHYKYYQMAPYIKKNRRVVNVFSDYESPFLVLKRTPNILPVISCFKYIFLFRRTEEILKNVDLFISLTDIDAKELKKTFPAVQPVVINTGVDMDYFTRNKKINEDPMNLIFVGYYRHPPNVDAMLFFTNEVFPKILKVYPEAHLYIVGKDPTPEILALNGKNITVTGFVKDIRPYIDKSGVYIVPIRQGAGIRGKIFQAWSMKKAVISTPRAAEGLKINHPKNIIIADSAEALSQGIKELIKNSGKRKRLGIEGYQTAKKHYSWEIKIKEMEKKYLELVSKKRKKL